MSETADRFEGVSERYWEEVFRMVDTYKSINLGSGMPDFDAYPQSIIDALIDVTSNGGYSVNQYTIGIGLPRLNKVLAKLYSILLKQTVDSQNILITVGAYEALHCAIFGLLNPGQEVIIIEPHYDCYVPMVRAAGGVPVYIALKRVKTNNNIEWTLDLNELESKFSDKTRLILVNTPQNPSGKVFNRKELEKISELCQKFNVFAVMDEVYEWITYEDNKHFRLASIPGMFERSITIGSAGKTFSVTGWKCGWAITGNPNLMTAISTAHSACVCVVPTITQEAIARVFELELTKLTSGRTQDLYWTQMSEMLSRKRKNILEMMRSVGLEPIAPEGSYFVVADCQQIIKRLDLNEFYDKRGESFAFVRWLSKNGIQAIPLSVFYIDQYKHLAEGLVRFCFIKSDDTLDKVSKVFTKVKQILDEKNN